MGAAVGVNCARVNGSDANTPVRIVRKHLANVCGVMPSRLSELMDGNTGRIAGREKVCSYNTKTTEGRARIGCINGRQGCTS